MPQLESGRRASSSGRGAITSSRVNKQIVRSFVRSFIAVARTLCPSRARSPRPCARPPCSSCARGWQRRGRRAASGSVARSRRRRSRPPTAPRGCPSAAGRRRPGTSPANAPSCRAGTREPPGHDSWRAKLAAPGDAARAAIGALDASLHRALERQHVAPARDHDICRERQSDAARLHLSARTNRPLTNAPAVHERQRQRQRVAALGGPQRAQLVQRCVLRHVAQRRVWVQADTSAGERDDGKLPSRRTRRRPASSARSSSSMLVAHGA